MKGLALVLGGYAIGRYLEAQAQGVPLDQAFNLSTILTPVSRLAPASLPYTPQQTAAASINTPLSTFFGVQLPAFASLYDQ